VQKVISSKVDGFKDSIGMGENDKKGGEKDKKHKDISGVSWNSLNFPPVVPMFHFDPPCDPMPNTARAIIKWIHNTFRVTIVALGLNLLWTFIFTVSGVTSGLSILYSALYIVFGGGLSLYGLYAGYKGVVADDKKLRMQYAGVQGLLGMGMFLTALLVGGNVHGWLGCAYPPPGIGTGWTIFFIIICVVEGLLWSALTGADAYSVIRVVQYLGHPTDWKPEQDVEAAGEKTSVTGLSGTKMSDGKKAQRAKIIKTKRARDGTSKLSDVVAADDKQTSRQKAIQDKKKSRDSG